VAFSRSGNIPGKYRYLTLSWELRSMQLCDKIARETPPMSAHTATAPTSSADLIARRIAEVTKPEPSVAEKPEKKVPLTWEEEELAFYEPKRSVAVEAKRRADARAALLLRQLPHQWKALCDVITIRCESVNNKAQRPVLRPSAPDKDQFEVRREDDQGFFMKFDLEKKKVTFSGKPLGFSREYELIVVTRDDVDSTTWFSSTALATEPTDELAKAMISVLLRFDQQA
jgi:hypothetical protein